MFPFDERAFIPDVAGQAVTFIPEATGQVIDPLEMEAEKADAIFGKPLMDALRERAERPPSYIGKYVQMVRVED